MIGAGVACMAVVLAPAHAAAAPVIVDRPVVDLGARLGKISGYGDVLAWSEYNASEATFSLVIQRHGQAPRRLNIVPRHRPFDVDAGPDRDGKPALVYSRCRKEPKQPDPRGLYEFYDLPAYPGGSRCDIYKYSLAAGRERRLKDISTHSADEFMPSIWRGKVAFVREYSPGRPLRLYLNRRDGSGSRQLRRSVLGDDVPSLDLRGRRVAYETVRLADDCEQNDIRFPSDAAFRTYMRIVELGRKPIRVAVSCNNDSRQGNLAGAAWSGSRLIYSADRGQDYEAGQLVARASNGTQQALASYAIPDSYIQYLAANDHGIYGAVLKKSDGHAHISHLLGSP